MRENYRADTRSPTIPQQCRASSKAVCPRLRAAGRGGGGGSVVGLYPGQGLQPCTTKLMSSHRLHHRSLAPFVQLHLFIFVLLVSAAVSVALQPHAYAGMMDLISMSSIAFLMFMSLYFIGYDKQPSGAAFVWRHAEATHHVSHVRHDLGRTSTTGHKQHLNARHGLPDAPELTLEHDP